MKNKEIAQIFWEIASLLSLKNENPFRIRAYEKAAQVIESLPQPIEEIYEEGKLQTLPGIGSGMVEKISEYLSTGSLKYLEDLRKEIPAGLLEIMSIPGMGPKKAKLVYDKLHITSIAELEKAAKEGKLRHLEGFGEKTEQNILRGIQLKQQVKGRVLLFEGLRVANSIVGELKKLDEVVQISPAGSIRRKKETIGDIDILVTVKRGKEQKVMDRFTHLPIVEEVLASGVTKSSIITEEGIQVDLRVVDPNQYGAALQYFTGSKEHNIALRELANKKKLTISEYGVFKVGEKEKPIAGKTEEEVYRVLGLDYIPPELRENRGEIEAAAEHRLPKLVKEEDILGDTHIHSKYSDGGNSITEIIEKARQMKLSWVIICDHSQSLKVAGGVSVKDLYKKIEEINKMKIAVKDVRVLCGMEVDILPDGRLDYPDEVLKDLDFVIAAVHTGFKQSEEQMTNRVMKAMENKYVHALSHPSGRLIGKRDPYAINMDKILKKAAEMGVWLEINAFPERLDLNDIYSKKAKEMGILLAIGTDAHNLTQMEYLYQGVYVAQRAWLEKKDVINTYPYEELLKLLKYRR
jgi:DNA polymerase (family 10)